MDTSTEEFANIDDLLGGDNEDEDEIVKENVEEEVKEQPEFITDEQEPDICDEGFDNDNNDPQLPLSTSTSQANEDTCSKSGVFCSNLLENVLEKESGLVGSVKV